MGKPEIRVARRKRRRYSVLDARDEVMQGNGVRNQKNTTPEEITVLLKQDRRWATQRQKRIYEPI
jgi:hypothetical protein